jgi:phosphoenolpyruvate-protein kinase (PTS system EI component)
MSERVLRGAPASPGLAAGHARVLVTPSWASAREPVPEGELEAEAARARAALSAAASELERIAAGLREKGRDEEAEIIETGALMAADPVLESAVTAAVLGRRASAAAALLEATEDHAQVIDSLPDAVLAARADDVRSLGRRAARIAAGAGELPAPAPGAVHNAAGAGQLASRAPGAAGIATGAGGEAGQNGSTFILVAQDLGPADVAEYGERAAGIALSAGGTTAHAAIVARSLGIPMAVQAGEELLSVADDTAVVVDGGEGEVVVDASRERLELAESASRARAHARAKERADSALPAVTSDGRRVRVLVNAVAPAEVAAGLSAGAEGAGLIRTELAFLDAPGWPSRADHLRMLRPLLAGLTGLTATIRVLDFGGDKIPPFLRDEPRRGIELLLAHPGAFRAQLAAIAQVAGAGQRAATTSTGRAAAPDSRLLRVLLPLVRSADDVRLTRAMLGPAGTRLSLGAMIELPEAAEAAHEIATECDFMSVGTNDLTHATLGTDRFAHGEAPAHDPRVLRHIAAAARAASEAGIPLEICGEAASDPLTVPLLVGLGADELSVGAARVGTVRAWIRALNHGETVELARQALDAADAAEVERLARPLAAVG